MSFHSCDDSAETPYVLMHGPCDYMPTSFEKAMVAVLQSLRSMGVDMIGSRGEARIEYFGSFDPYRTAGFTMRQAEGPGMLVSVEIEHRQGWRGTDTFTVPMKSVILEIREALGMFS